MSKFRAEFIFFIEDRRKYVKIDIEKAILFSVFFALAQCCEGANIQTYILGTDAAYVQPTVQTIYSLNRHTPGPKRIIVLETDDICEKNDRDFEGLSLGDDVALLRWKISKLKEHLDENIKEAYNEFCKRARWKKREGVNIRVLFPILFNKDNLEKAGYAGSLGAASEEQSLNHFVWLDSDIVALKNLGEFYKLSNKLPKNDDHIPQPVMSTDLSWNLYTCKDYKLNTDGKGDEQLFSPSGGVVFWNLTACRELLSNQDFACILSNTEKENNNLDDEIFIFHFLKNSWKKTKVCTAEKIFNIKPSNWLSLIWYYNFQKFLEADESDRESYLKKAIDAWPAVFRNKQHAGRFMQEALEI